MKTKKPLSERTKWIICAALLALAVLTVVLCAAGGAFHFEYKAVSANDAAQTPEPTPSEEPEEEDDFTGNVYTVFISAGSGGKVNPNGRVKVKAWDDLTLSFVPNEGYVLSSVTVDGAEVGTNETYTLSYVTKDHSIVASFEPVPEETEPPTEENTGESPEITEDLPE